MTFNYWTKEEESLLLELLHIGACNDEIEEQFEIRHGNSERGFETLRGVGAIKRKITRIQRGVEIRAALESEPEELQLDEDLDDPDYEYQAVDRHWEALATIQKRYNEDSKFSDIGIAVKPPVTKILVLSDIHFPMANLDFLNQAIDDNRDADGVVLNGDLLDGYMFSTFDKDKTVAANDEYRATFEFVELCSKLFPWVVLIQGNHDIRSEKAMARSTIPRSGQGVFQSDLLARIANGERLDRNGMVVEKVPMTNVFYPASEKWWVQIGKTIFIHPHSRGSSKPGYTVSSWAHKFQERLPHGSFDCVVSGHTHQQSKHVQGNLLLIEQGCLCDYMSYSWQPRQIFHSSAVSGYAVIYQDEDGNTDFNMSNFVYLGQLLPTDKPLYSGQ